MRHRNGHSAHSCAGIADRPRSALCRSCRKSCCLRRCPRCRPGNASGLSTLWRAHAAGIRQLAGQIYAQFGRAPQATRLADALASKLDADAQAYGQLLHAEVALAQKNARAALDDLKAAQRIADTWPGRLLFARTYFDLGAFAEASSELDIVAKRRGEATAMFLDDVPTYRVYAQVPTWVTRVQDSLKSQARRTAP